MKRILVISSSFSAAHLYKNDTLTEAENKKFFGRCYTEHGHGHNYKIEVGFLILPSLQDGEVYRTKKLLDDEIFKLTNKLDHQHLNFDIAEFEKTIPTTENILLYFEKKILSLKLNNPSIKGLAFIKLFEMENLYSEKYYVTVH